MLSRFRAGRVIDPNGVVWRVGRRWLTRRVRGTWRGRREAGSETGSEAARIWLSGSADLEGALFGVVVVVGLVLVVIPVLLFGVELIIVGCVLAASIVGRSLLGRPWIVEAAPVLPGGDQRLLTWHVVGWRHSRRRIAEIAGDLAAGRELAVDQEGPHEAARATRRTRWLPSKDPDDYR